MRISFMVLCFMLSSHLFASEEAYNFLLDKLNADLNLQDNTITTLTGKAGVVGQRTCSVIFNLKDNFLVLKDTTYNDIKISLIELKKETGVIVQSENPNELDRIRVESRFDLNPFQSRWEKVEITYDSINDEVEVSLGASETFVSFPVKIQSLACTFSRR